MGAGAPLPVAVVLVNWNSHADTLACVESLASCDYRDLEVIVVDNGSRRESVEALRHAGGIDRLIEVPDNLGFTGANNLGIRAALEGAAQCVFVLNNDTVVRPNAISLLVQALRTQPSLGITAPKVLFMEPPHLVWYGGGYFTTIGQNPVMMGYRQPDDGRWNTPGDVAFVSGCAMMISRGLLEKLEDGVFVDAYFAVWEDADLCRKARSMGFGIGYVPSAVVLHKESAAVGGNDAPGYVYYQVRNRILYLRRWVRGPKDVVLAWGYSALYLMKRAASLAFARRWEAVVAIGAGTADGLAGRWGRRARANRALDPNSR
jgi:GT2 family glycosyltransferase